MTYLSNIQQQEMMNDKCGVFGIYNKNDDVGRTSYFGLFSLQHRGQEGAGITVSDGYNIFSVKGLGLVPSIFSEANISSLKGHIAIGHTRYSTTGGNVINNVQPIEFKSRDDDFALAHNGNIINALTLAKNLKDVRFTSSTDSEVMGWIIKKNSESSWEKKILSSMHLFKGAFSVVAMSKNKLFAFRDPFGFRPLVVGKLNGGFVVCSETCALDAVGAHYLRDVEPGEVILIDQNGLQSVGSVRSKRRAFCLFEYVYLARPDSILNKILVHKVRRRSGEILARESPVDADIVAAIPDSGTTAAIGYSKASGIPFGEIFIKNRYIARTFIQPDQHIRELGVRIKFNPLISNVKNKRIIIVDDSIVRGTTIKKIIALLRKCKAKEIHVRVCSPPIKHPCYFGVDTPYRNQLISSSLSVSKVEKYIDADSLRYLSLKGLKMASEQKKNTMCYACFNGKYPLPIDKNIHKSILENQKPEKVLRLALFISGKGTTAEAVIRACKSGELKNLQPLLVISNNYEAPGLQVAKNLGIDAYVVDPTNYQTAHQFGMALLKLMTKYKIDIISQNGWLVKTPPNIIKKYRNKIINQHPGPLDPGRAYHFGGKGMYGERVISSRLAYAWLTGEDYWTEATTHIVSREYDEGKILKNEEMEFAPYFNKIDVEELRNHLPLLAEYTTRLKNKLLKLEHQTVIDTLSEMSYKKNHGYKRPERLVKADKVFYLNKAKDIAHELYKSRITYEGSQKIKVVGFGALNADFIKHTDNSLSPLVEAGGSATNTLCALSKLGIFCGTISRVGCDQESDLLVDSLKNFNIDLFEVTKDKINPSGKAQVSINHNGSRNIKVVPGANSFLDRRHINLEYISASSWIHYSSFLDEKQMALQLWTASKLKDSIRSSYNVDEHIKDYGYRYFAQIVPFIKTVIIKGSVLKQLTGLRINDGVKKIIRDGAENVVVIHDSYQSEAFSESEHFFINMQTYPIKDMTGASGAYCAGFIYGQINNYGLKKSATLGHALMSLCTEKIGCRTNLPKYKELIERSTHIIN